ncbi:hypothetical protein ACFLZO_01035 [Patescibacteria group bacterium]
MILYIDIQNKKSTVGVVGARHAEWITGAPKGGVYALLEKADDRFGIFTKRPAVVVVASGSEGRDVTWSAIRTGVAMANTLAFTWGAVVAEVVIDGNATEKEKVTKIRAAAKRTKRGKWLKAKYGGEPNITKAKPVL